jgi:sulfatase maturation enzyme AslB (radical SAM superfamily)
MANAKTFCNIPWFHLEIKHDGSFGLCCIQERDNNGYAVKLEKHNIREMSIQEWYSSRAMKNYRLKMLSSTPLTECNGCYTDEKHGNESYRLTQNWRSAIFTKDAFAKSFVQSPHYPIFKLTESSDGEYNGLPVDLHIDMGNECNLACKFCHPNVSSKIAAKYKKWNILTDYQSQARVNWMDDDETWLKFCNELLSFEHLKSVHFMGGEPTLSPRLEQFLDFFISNKKTNFAISFVTNGTRFCPEIIVKMKQFFRADIDISIESILDNNYYMRQGLKKELFMSNVNQYLAAQSDNFYVCLKPVISALTVSTFPELIEYFFDNSIFTESNICWDPAYLRVDVLPTKIRNLYLPKYEKLLQKLTQDQNFKNTNMLQARFHDKKADNLYNELLTAYNMLLGPEHENAKELQKQMVWWLSKWDKEYHLNAKDHYPEWSDFLDQHDYQV